MRMRNLSLIIFFIFFLYSFLNSKIIIFSPYQNSILVYKKVEIIGKYPKKINNIKVINYNILSKRIIEKKFFVVVIALNPGENKILIKINNKETYLLKLIYSKKEQNYFKHRFIDINNCTICHSKNLKVIKIAKGNCTTGICHQNILKYKFIHGPVGIKNCISCHNPHGANNKKLLIKTGEKLCYSCHKEKTKKFNKKLVHAPVRKGECISCHDPHGSPNKYQLKGKSIDNFCYNCHNKKKFLGKKFVHGPVGVGKCLSCHDAHASNQEYLIKVNKNTKILCFKCHNKKRFFSGKYVHGPVGGGLCTKCHDPHCSNNKKLLVKTILEGKLCFECHNRFKIIDSKYVHGPVGAGMCLSCHKIHSANYNFLLRIDKKGGKLCFDCHKDAQIKFSKIFVHKPVQKDCIECHDAHSSTYKYQLIGDYKIEVCLKCHKNIKKLLKIGTPHPIISEKGCKVCHNPHASDYRYQLFNKINKVCKFCHVRFKNVKKGHPVVRHPVKGKRNPLNKSKRFNCASCHNPHASKYKFLLIGSLKNFEVCKKCHINY